VVPLHGRANPGARHAETLYLELELPSNLHGVLYILAAASSEWRLKLGREKKVGGLPVDVAASMVEVHPLREGRKGVGTAKTG